MEIQKILSRLRNDLNNAEIQINRNKTEDELTIKLPNSEIYATEYGDVIKIDGTSYPYNNAYQTLLQIIKVSI